MSPAVRPQARRCGPHFPAPVILGLRFRGLDPDPFLSVSPPHGERTPFSDPKAPVEVSTILTTW